jgi:hypothetical protein
MNQPYREGELMDDFSGTVLWTLTKYGQQTHAVMRPIKDMGVELRLLMNDELSVTQLYEDLNALLEVSEAQKQDLEQHGWRPEHAEETRKAGGTDRGVSGTHPFESAPATVPVGPAPTTLRRSRITRVLKG